LGTDQAKKEKTNRRDGQLEMMCHREADKSSDEDSQDDDDFDSDLGDNQEEEIEGHDRRVASKFTRNALSSSSSSSSGCGPEDDDWITCLRSFPPLSSRSTTAAAAAAAAADGVCATGVGRII
jgi:hypothetical protein